MRAGFIITKLDELTENTGSDLIKRDMCINYSLYADCYVDCYYKYVRGNLFEENHKIFSSV